MIKQSSPSDIPISIRQDILTRCAFNRECQVSEANSCPEFSAKLKSLTALINSTNSTRKRDQIFRSLAIIVYRKMSMEEIDGAISLLDTLAARSHTFTLKRHSQFIDAILNTCLFCALRNNPSLTLDWLLESAPNVVARYLYPAIWGIHADRLAVRPV